MENFVIKNINNNLSSELEEIGFDKSYIFEGIKKFQYKNFKIFDLTPAQANILKQTALTVGADCAVHRDVISGKPEKSNCILGGSISQIKKISQKLKAQPLGLKKLGEQLESIISDRLKPFTVKGKTFDFSRPYIVGILNLGKSFSDGYQEFEQAKEHALKLINDGADILDIGAESTRPGASAVDDETQIKKLLPILKFLKDKNIPISIDTRSSKVAKECLLNGADIINDVSGFDYDEKIIDVISEFNCPIIIQHSSSTPDKMQEHTDYENLIEDIYNSLKNKIKISEDKNIENIIIDIGIGFGKTREQNLELLQRFEEFTTLNKPIMLGISRKSFLNMQDADNFTKDIYTLGINSILMSKGVNFVRVHNVELHKKLLDIEILK